MDDSLKQQILASRQRSIDNSVVTYDLTSGVDFSHPRSTAEALAQVFFELDAKNWFVEKGEDLEFVPSYKVKIMVSSSNTKRFNATFKDMLKDVENKDLKVHFAKEVRAASVPDDPGMFVIMTSSFLTVMAMEHAQRKSLMKKYLEKLVNEIKSNIEVETTS